MRTSPPTSILAPGCLGHFLPSTRPFSATYTYRDTLGTSLSPLQYPHNIPQLAVRRLGGEPPPFSWHDRLERQAPKLRPVEWLRRLIGLVAGSAAPS